jgi:hypothetical protein
MTWTGWYRRRPTEAWQPLCQGRDLASCHRKLLALTPADAPSSSRFLTAGPYPEERRLPRRADGR